MTELPGYLAAILIGISLGLIGSGGSILTVPVLVYIFGISPVLATAYSLFIVGITALSGSFNLMKRKLVDYKAAIIFSIPSLLAVFAVRKFLMPVLPESLFYIFNFEVGRDFFIMFIFAIMMIIAALFMILDTRSKSFTGSKTQSFNYPLILIEGFIVGAVTGFVGAGGGFLIIPALVLLAKLPMKIAVGTSLLIIAIKSLIGFTGDMSEQYLDWWFLAKFTMFAISGIFIGGLFLRKIKSEKLKPVFGWFVLLMAVYIIVKEVV